MADQARGAQILDARIARIPRAAPDRPVIEVQRGGAVEMTDAAIAALRGAGSAIYDRGGMLVRPVEVAATDRAGGIVRQAGAMVLRAVTPTWLAHELARVAMWQRYDARAREYRAADVPERVALTIVDAPDIGAWPALYAVVRAPVALSDGRIISRPGYDAETGLLADWTGEWPLPETPTRDDAADALRRLREMLRNYTWETDADAAVAVSSILTAIMRPALAAAPMHAITSPEPGSGKSLLVDAASIIATGTPAAVMDWSDDAAEAAKPLDSVMLAGDPIITLDNVERPIEGATLCQILTQGARRIRPLGASVAVSVPCVSMIAATGCNLVLRGDIVRRAVVCRIDAGTERPELRAIAQDLLAEARERRREIVADAVAITAAYVAAGCPDIGLSTLGSYADWHRMVRAPMVWVGSADPAATMDRIRADDPGRAAMRAVYRAWHAVCGSEAVTVAELIRRADADRVLSAALGAVADRRGHLDSRALGWWCRAHRDRRIGGLRLVARGETREGTQTWSMAD